MFPCNHSFHPVCADCIEEAIRTIPEAVRTGALLFEKEDVRVDEVTIQIVLDVLAQKFCIEQPLSQGDPNGRS